MEMSEYYTAVRSRVGRETILVPMTVAIVLDARGAVLLTRPSETERWHLPGGAMELGESVLGSLRRCLRDVAGVSSQRETFLGIYSGRAFERLHTEGDIAPVTMVFIVRQTEPTDLLPAPGHRRTPMHEWFALDGLPDALDPAAERPLLDFIARSSRAPILE